MFSHGLVKGEDRCFLHVIRVYLYHGCAGEAEHERRRHMVR